MAIGDQGHEVPSDGRNSPQGPADNSGRVGKHVSGSGSMPGTGASAGESDQHPGNTHDAPYGSK